MSKFEQQYQDELNKLESYSQMADASAAIFNRLNDRMTKVNEYIKSKS